MKMLRTILRDWMRLGNFSASEAVRWITIIRYRSRSLSGVCLPLQKEFGRDLSSIREERFCHNCHVFRLCDTRLQDTPEKLEWSVFDIFLKDTEAEFQKVQIYRIIASNGLKDDGCVFLNSSWKLNDLLF